MLKVPVTLTSNKSATALRVDNGKITITIFPTKKVMHEFFENKQKPFAKKTKGQFFGELPRRQALSMALNEELRKNGLEFFDYADGNLKTSELVEVDEATLKIVKSHSDLPVAMSAILTWKAKEAKAEKAKAEKAETEKTAEVKDTEEDIF